MGDYYLNRTTGDYYKKTTASSSHTSTYVSDGDANGIIYFAGTNYGASAWTNPITAGYLGGVRSSESGGTIVNLVNHAADGDVKTGNVANSWAAIDLGASRLATISKYSLQNRGSNRAIRTWKLQGSNNAASNSVADLAAATWTTLDSRSGDTTMADAANAWGTYTPATLTGQYRWFRILQDGTNAQGDNFLCIAEIELYGVWVSGGAWTLQGNIKGADGVANISFGSGNPAGSGVEKDVYVNTVNGDIWFYHTGAWTLYGANAYRIQGKAIDASATTTSPTNGDLLTYDSSLFGGVGGWKAAPSAALNLDYALIQDQKAQGTNGGTATNASWLKRTLNTIVTDTGSNITSLTADEFTLKAGTYRVCISVPALECQRHQARLYNVTDAAVLLIGTSEFSQTTSASGTRSFIVGRITLATAKTLRVEHQFSAATANTYVRGEAGNFTTEIYTQVELIKESGSFGGLDAETRARLNLAIL